MTAWCITLFMMVHCETAAYMQAISVGGLVESTPAAAATVQLKRSMREELRRLIHESSIVIARDRLRLLDIVGQGIVGYTA